MSDLIERDALLLKQKAHADLFADSTAHDDIVRFDESTAALAEIINAPSVNRWIPVEDALPEIGYNVLVTRQTESNARYIRIASRQDDCWIDSTDEYGKPNPHPVIAWMPMPDAYKPPEKE